MGNVKTFSLAKQRYNSMKIRSFKNILKLYVFAKLIQGCNVLDISNENSNDFA